jgi:class 3 adenylate cyclase
MEQTPDLNRTWLCSVLFLDIVNYSSQSVQVQMEWKAFLNDSLTEALRPVLPANRVILDTGDGAAICFLGGPEEAMLSALALHNNFVGRTDEPAPLRIRTGINLGPVKLVKDINGSLNAIGDGINVGQRIMSFAEPNQILTSRSYYEVVSALTDDYRRLFRPGGTREDKHVREHVVYELVSSTPSTRGESAGTSSPPPQTLRVDVPRPSGRRKRFVIGAAGAGFLVLALSLAILELRRPLPPQAPSTSIPASSTAKPVIPNASNPGPADHTPDDQAKPKDSAFNTSPVTRTAAASPTTLPPAAQTSAVAEPLRTAKTTLSVEQAKAMVVTHDFYQARWNESGKGVRHQYRKQVLQGAIVVADPANGRMWQQGGSDNDRPSGFDGAEQYVLGLNMKNFAGFSDWRLPTLEEAMSIMTAPQGGTPDEPVLGDKVVKGVMHLDPMFDKSAAPFIWTSDLASPEKGWVVYYADGICSPESLQFSASVRAVRSAGARQ